MDKNKRFAELAGICWHEYENSRPKWLGDNCLKCGRLYRDERDNDPDFTSDAGKVRLLREMTKLVCWNRFATSVFMLSPVMFMLNDTGKFLDAAIKFLEEEGGRDE